MVTQTLKKPEILVADQRLADIFQKAFSKFGLRPGKHGWRTIKIWPDLSPHSMAPLLIASMLEDITKEKIKVFRERARLRNRYKVFLLFKGGLPSRAVADRMAWLDVRKEDRIHFVITKKGNEGSFAERLLIALDRGDYDNRILDVWWEDDTLVVVSPTSQGFRKLRVQLQRLPALQSYERKKLENFKIDEDGTFVYWPSIGIHLGWEQFEQAVDQQAYLKAKQQSDAFNKAYGSAIRTLREKNALRQSDIKGLTPRQVGRLERGECRATHNALSKLANAHNMTTSDYMGQLANLLGT